MPTQLAFRLLAQGTIGALHAPNAVGQCGSSGKIHLHHRTEHHSHGTGLVWVCQKIHAILLECCFCTIYVYIYLQFVLLLFCSKDNGRQLRFTTPSYADTLRVHESIQTYAFPGRRNLGYLFAFESKREQVMSSVRIDPNTGKKAITLPPTRKRFDPLVEFPRQFGTNATSPKIATPWHIYITLNQSYQLCMSYPSVLVGPSTLNESSPETQRILRQSANFRSGQRLPALTWGNAVDGASLWRCSQPKVGLQGNRSAADEAYLQHIMECAQRYTVLEQKKEKMPPKWVLQKLTGSSDLSNYWPDPGTRLKILDLRPRSSAMANRTSGMY